jgi:hypothetical protein
MSKPGNKRQARARGYHRAKLGGSAGSMAKWQKSPLSSGSAGISSAQRRQHHQQSAQSQQTLDMASISGGVFGKMPKYVQRRGVSNGKRMAK